MSAPSSWVASEPSPYCGRVDEHPPHEWIGTDWREFPPSTRVIRECPGTPVIEGGNPAQGGD